MAPHSTSSMIVSPASPTRALDQARHLQLPSREEVLRRDSKVYDFWNQNDVLLEKAWEEWQQTDKKAAALPRLDSSLINAKLRKAVQQAWNDPSKEDDIKDLWEEVAPGVFAVQFFDTQKVNQIRAWFDAAAEAGIPTRQPYGIVLNRKGFMTDPRSVGYLAAPDFQRFYKDLVDTYVRPLGRLFFPSHIKEVDDSESFSFSIQYQGEAGGDKSIRQHTDASTITFNINLDSEETWTGSSLIFYHGGRQYPVHWAPGLAVMHRGRSMHAALPIESGTRSNLVVWTFGKDRGMGYGNPMMTEDGYYPKEYQMSPQERWTKPHSDPTRPWDRWSPF